MPQTEEPNRRVLQEIEQILEADERKNDKPVLISKPVKPRKVRVGTPWWMPTAEKAIVAGMLLLLIAAVSRWQVVPLAVTGIVIAAGGYIALIRRRRAGRGRGGLIRRSKSEEPPSYWRGRPVGRIEAKKRDGNIVEFPDTWQNRVRRKFGRRR